MGSQTTFPRSRVSFDKYWRTNPGDIQIYLKNQCKNHVWIFHIIYLYIYWHLVSILLILFDCFLLKHSHFPGSILANPIHKNCSLKYRGIQYSFHNNSRYFLKIVSTRVHTFLKFHPTIFGATFCVSRHDLCLTHEILKMYAFWCWQFSKNAPRNMRMPANA